VYWLGYESRRRCEEEGIMGVFTGMNISYVFSSSRKILSRQLGGEREEYAQRLRRGSWLKCCSRLDAYKTIYYTTTLLRCKYISTAGAGIYIHKSLSQTSQNEF
jgi:hypothetical protein